MNTVAYFDLKTKKFLYAINYINKELILGVDFLFYMSTVMGVPTHITAKLVKEVIAEKYEKFLKGGDHDYRNNR